MKCFALIAVLPLVVANTATLLRSAETVTLASKKEPAYFHAHDKPEAVHFGPVQYISIKGKGEPAGQEFIQKVSALWVVFNELKKDRIIAETEQNALLESPRLEGLWWTENGKDAFTTPRSEWNWEVLVRIPKSVDKTAVKAAVEMISEKKVVSSDEVQFRELTEGDCVQMMHTGPYANEAPTISEIHHFIEQKGWRMAGLHHEIYLTDPKETAPSEMKTIIRQPISK